MPEKFEPRNFLQPAMDAVTKLVEDKIEALEFLVSDSFDSFYSF